MGENRRRRRPGAAPASHDGANTSTRWADGGITIGPSGRGVSASSNNSSLRHRHQRGGSSPRNGRSPPRARADFSSLPMPPHHDASNDPQQQQQANSGGGGNNRHSCSSVPIPIPMMMIADQRHRSDMDIGGGDNSSALLDDSAGGGSDAMRPAMAENGENALTARSTRNIEQHPIGIPSNGESSHAATANNGEPVYTDSGLQLTHRKIRNCSPSSAAPVYITRSNSNTRPASAADTVIGMTSDRQRRMLTYVRLGTAALFATIVLGTGVAVSTIAFERSVSAPEDQQPLQQREEERLLKVNKVARPPALPSDTTTSKTERRHYAEEVVQELRLEFNSWVERHSRDYGSHEERERRFGIWLDNHHDTIELNERHGPCPLTGKKVFGDNHLKDLAREEFKTKYLTGYTGPRAEHLPKEKLVRTDQAMARKKLMEDAKVNRVGQQRSRSVKTTPHDVERHPDVQKRYLEYVPVAADNGGNDGHSTTNIYKQGDSAQESNLYGSFTLFGCKWYDTSCILKYLFTGHILGGVREPEYDGDSYPSAVDWRDMGVVTSIHSQGGCGACWGITAIETIESAYAIRSGSLVDLSESEVIACDDTCKMCEGGWPQNAYEYVMKHNGVPAESDWSYDGDWLLLMTYVMSGESDEYDQSEILEYLYSQCPNYGQSGSGHSDDNSAYYNAGDEVSYTRYGQISGYGYSTDKCLCYTDGTGCDCDEQNEKLAIGNVASYGPATVCIDAMYWQNYDGGILTSDSGCGSGFMDMNHCVQAVGYAFTDGTENGAEEENADNQNSHQSGSGSGDDAQRVGYWIIRNQWGSNWGMNGYIYVAMGDNACGILNDMTQVYS